MTTNPPITAAHETWMYGYTYLGALVIVHGEAYGRAVNDKGHPVQCAFCGCSVVRIVEEARGDLTRFCADCGAEFGRSALAIDEYGTVDELRAALAWSMFEVRPCGSRLWCSCSRCVSSAFSVSA